MPVKRRMPKKRTTSEAEAEAWEMMFECGTDYFSDLPFTNNDEARVAARGAWRRLGAIFLAQRPANEKVPWALEEFGEPSKRRRAKK